MKSQDEFDLGDVPENSGVAQFSSVLYMHHNFYITGAIASARNYIDMCNSLSTMSEANSVNMYINSEGGDICAALQIIRSMQECQAPITAIAVGQCSSAATMIFLSADSWEVNPHTIFLFHNYRGLKGGKGGEMFDAIMFERLWSTALMKDFYKDFLTEEEINSIIEDKDILMGAEEVLERLQKRAKIREAVS